MKHLNYGALHYSEWRELHRLIYNNRIFGKANSKVKRDHTLDHRLYRKVWWPTSFLTTSVIKDSGCESRMTGCRLFTLVSSSFFYKCLLHANHSVSWMPSRAFAFWLWFAISYVQSEIRFFLLSLTRRTDNYRRFVCSLIGLVPETSLPSWAACWC